MISEPEIRYVARDGKDLAFQVVGSGPHHVVNVLEVPVHLDLLWTDPSWAQQLDRFQGLWRMALFQPRGVGLSDPTERRPTIEEQASDLEAVMDAAGMGEAVVFATFSTCPGAVVFAAASPERVKALLLLNPMIAGPDAADPDLTGWEPGEAATYAAGWSEVTDRWGTGHSVLMWDPVIASPRTVRQVALIERTSASRSVARANLEAAMRTDVSRIVPHVRVPTHVLHMPTTRLPEAVMRHLADLLPMGQLHILPPSELGMSYAESFVPFFEVLAEVVAGQAPEASDRTFVTVMFEDVVGSTDLVSRLGDTAWRELSVRRDRLVANCVEEHNGTVIKTAGDGSMSSFPGPAAAVRCAGQLHAQARALDVQLRVGIHAGECERVGDDLAGLAVHVAARIGDSAAPGETLVSQTVADLVAGSELRFVSRGTHELRGVPGSWELLAAGEDSRTIATQPMPAPTPRLTDRFIVATARRSPRVMTALQRWERTRARRRA